MLNLFEKDDIINFIVSLKLKYILPENNFAKYDFIAPTGLAIDILLSFKITINFVLESPALFMASYAMPALIAPSPITAITSSDLLESLLAVAIPNAAEIDVEL